MEHNTNLTHRLRAVPPSRYAWVVAFVFGWTWAVLSSSAFILLSRTGHLPLWLIAAEGVATVVWFGGAVAAVELGNIEIDRRHDRCRMADRIVELEHKTDMVPLGSDPAHCDRCALEARYARTEVEQ